MLNIGILLPRSTFYGTINFDLLEGMRAGLQAAGRSDIRVVSENIGFGTDHQQCYRAAERMLMDENVSVVFAYIGHRTAQMLRPLFMAANRLLVVLDAGANMPNEWPASPNVLYLSLHNSLGIWLAAANGIRDGFRQAGLITGYFDAGYLHMFAAQQSWHQHGGETAFVHATGFQRDAFSMEPLKDHLTAVPDACLLALFSGDFTQWFLEEMHTHFPGGLPPIYTAPFALEETMLDQTPFPGTGIKGVAAWSRHLDTPENTQFKEALDAAGYTANLFSLLGWEAGTLAGPLCDLMAANRRNGREVLLQLKQQQFVTPRGLLSFHDATNHSLSPMYEVTLVADNNGNCRLQTGQSITETGEALAQLAACELNQTVSGWFNSYICN